VNIYLGPMTLTALGEVDELDLLASFDGDLRLLSQVVDEVTTEPARSNLFEQIGRVDVEIGDFGGDPFREVGDAKEEAKRALNEETVNGDVAIVARVIQLRRKDTEVAIVSDDRRLRTVAEGLGARVTGTIGVIISAVVGGDLTEQAAKDLVRRLDSRGLHVTGELVRKADELTEDAAGKNGGED
jgi:predicted nucleic acid-binding protein